MSETQKEADSKNRRAALEAAARVMSEQKTGYGAPNAPQVLRMADQFYNWLNGN